MPLVRMRVGVASALVGLVAAGCSGGETSTPSDVFFPTVPIQDSYPLALMDGVLEVRLGCVFVTAHDERWLLLWPEGYGARRGDDGGLVVVDAGGEIVAREGERLRVGGGETNPIEVGGAPEAERWARELTGQDIPERCGDLYWLVSP